MNNINNINKDNQSNMENNKVVKNKLYITLENKIIYFQNIIKKTLLSAKKYKVMDIIGSSELSLCITTLERLFSETMKLYIPISLKHKIDIDAFTSKLQIINDELANIFKSYGTETFDDLIKICFGNDYINKYIKNEQILNNKYEILIQHFHPINYKVFNWKHDISSMNYKKNNDIVTPTPPSTPSETSTSNTNYNLNIEIDNEKQFSSSSFSKHKKILQKNKIIEDFMIVELAESLECFDLARNSKNFQLKVYGIKVALQHPEHKKTIIVSGIVDDILIECINNKYIEEKINKLLNDKPNDEIFNIKYFERFLLTLTLKDLLVYNNEELYNRFAGYITQINLIKKKSIANIVNEFINNDLYSQRKMLIELLIKSNDHEFQYLSYLLYDILSTNDINGNLDTQEQTLLYDSLPWNVKKFFKDAMKQTIQYTNILSNFDNNKIPLEQQICLLKASDNVKEKAMIKLKEVKAKSEDSGSKARQYLEGLLKIPFGIYKQEEILSIMEQTKKIFGELVVILNTNKLFNNKIQVKNKLDYTSIEINKYSKILKNTYYNDMTFNALKNIKNNVNDVNYYSRNELINYIVQINYINKKYKIKNHKLCHSGKNIKYMRDVINKYITFLEKHEFNDFSNNEYNIYNDNNLTISNNENNENNENNSIKLNEIKLTDEIFFKVIYDLTKVFEIQNNIQNDNSFVNKINSSLKLIDNQMNTINEYMKNVSNTLNIAVHGHERAKRQVERIIGQWINGEKTGYCFGFEGPPGVGKTSLAKKGIAECLKDNNGVSRPFSFIAIGGSSNGSTLEGHNYTYVGATWGRIVDILMDKKCMNPIIFIDELDKVSKTEHGKEIIGILTHLIDPTQNDTFQDKYFNGIDLDLSKALFIFSYNDVSLIDKILLDRIHRIKFNHLTMDDKLTITKNYILPEIFNKMGLKDTLYFSDEVIEQIIQRYTNESGVRKLKEILFEIIGEINLSILKENKDFELPLNITFNDISNKYLKDRQEILIKKIIETSSVGIINGLWANSLGNGGVLPIEAHLFPTSTFLELKLTGMQGDVMKESMNVAKTLAWSLLEREKMKELIGEFDITKMQGIHIHCPEGATPKDGPSAGTAITTAIYSLMTNRKIKNDFAITGEICLQGKVTAIGGLDLKILGGIHAGVKNFIFPTENNKDFNDFYERYKDKSILNGINFHSVSHIKQVLDLILL
jgi:endopeptidase La